ncbi:MAG: exodeoxyribonuclease VII large subunit [Clostridiales bacterium]|nr:exodeoxyribonuclease VII large subunit [Clostridiales bacterium]
MEREWALSVTELNEYVRRQLAGDPMLRALRVRGELSGFKRHVSGHLYFSLKDEGGRVQCVMFRQNAIGLTFQPQDGMRVVASGAASLFVRDGAYQVYVSGMAREGVGDLYLRFEQLKKKLAGEGLFDPARKRELPLLPRSIGVVTSRTGAVLRDIVRVAHRRNPRLSIVLAAAAVQGEGAAQEIADGIDRLNQVGVDVILCGRGGGSIEDLWAFNEEVVARAIARSSIPVVSCVGHETDFTIADFVADLRAPTPSAAAELAVPMVDELQQAIDGLAGRLDRALAGRMEAARTRYRRLALSPALTNPRRLLIEGGSHRLDAMRARLDGAALRRLDGARARLTTLSRALAGLSPSAVIGRGYAVVRLDGRPVPDAAALLPGMRVEIQMRDGAARAAIED